MIDKGERPYTGDEQAETLRDNLIRKYKFRAYKEYGGSILLMYGQTKERKTVAGEIFLGPTLSYKVYVVPEDFGFQIYEGVVFVDYKKLIPKRNGKKEKT